jgi:nucleoside-diphosphate-sugar epimerase
VVADAFDAAALHAAVTTARPDAVIHQLTDLPDALAPAQMAEARVRNARLRETGTRHLVAATRAAGASRLVAQSIAFAYARGPLPHTEDNALDLQEGEAGVSARGVASLEAQVLAAPLHGMVLRYGRLYGPGTGFDAPSPGAPLHVHAAAHAAFLAATQGAAGIYNIAEDDGTVATEKARRELGWSAAFRLAGD